MNDREIFSSGQTNAVVMKVDVGLVYPATAFPNFAKPVFFCIGAVVRGFDKSLKLSISDFGFAHVQRIDQHGMRGVVERKRFVVAHVNRNRLEKISWSAAAECL